MTRIPPPSQPPAPPPDWKDAFNQLKALLSQLHPGYALGALALTVYGFLCATSPQTWRWLDGPNFLFHEAGHFFFRPFGRFLHFLGGTIGQLFFPIFCTILFAFKRQFFSASVTLFWTGQSLFNVSVYAADAVATQLPILEGRIHDWNWMLSRYQLLPHTSKIAWMIYLTGWILYLLSVAGAWRHSHRDHLDVYRATDEQGFF